MSNRLGRNPLKTPKKPRKSVQTIPTSASEIVKECMAEHPEKKSPPRTSLERLAYWVLIDIPAETYLLGLKSILLIKTAWD